MLIASLKTSLRLFFILILRNLFLANPVLTLQSPVFSPLAAFTLSSYSTFYRPRCQLTIIKSLASDYIVEYLALCCQD